MDLEIVATDDIARVSAEQWDALAGEDNPFVEHAFLELLERSGSVGPKTGWMPLHVLVFEGADGEVDEDEPRFEGRRVVGAAPCYLKGHSYGEYIFDWSWANAAAQAGLDYYPKLVVGVPHTPATGPRLLVDPSLKESEREEVRGALAGALAALPEKVGASSMHVLFCLDEEAAFLSQRGFFRRATHQFHWRNDPDQPDGRYADFEAFLGQLRSSARKQIRKERRRVREAGVDVELRRGNELSASEWDELYALYASTHARKWGDPYLTHAFFEDAGETLGERAVVAFARVDGEIVAGTLSFEKGRHLYGRYWGCHEKYDGLHFELCYYRLVEHAIDRGLVLVEAGAQGHHKLKRGYLPVVTHSCHRMVHPGLHEAIERAMATEASMVEREIAEAVSSGPFRDEAAPKFPPVAGIPLR